MEIRNRGAARRAAAIASARRIGRAVALLSLLWLAAVAPPPPAAGQPAASLPAASLPEVGSDVVGQLDLLGKRIPLPAGDWKVAAAGYGRVTGAEPGPYGAIGGVLLLPAAADPDHAFLLIHTNALPVRGGWGHPAACNVDDLLFQSAAEQRDLHNACTFVVARRAGHVVDPDLPALAGDRMAGALLPPWALEAGFRVSDRRDFVELLYGAAPPALAADGWATLDEPHQALVARLAAWAQAARSAALSALRDPFDQVLPLPAPPLADPKPGAAPAEENIGAARLATYKLITYRIASTTLGITAMLALTGDPYLSVTYAFWQGITHSAVYFANEMGWEWPASVPEAAIVGVASGASVAAAVDPPPPPAVFAVDGKQVPLPPGDWTLLAQQPGDDATQTVLAELDGKRLAGLVVIRSNPHATKNILGTTAECARIDIYYSVNRYDTPLDGFCSYAKPVTPDWTDGSGPWAGITRLLVDRGVDLPPVLTMVGARARTRENFLDVRYYFPPDPTTLALSLPDQGLAASRMANSAALREYVAALQSWADLLQEPLELGVRGRLPAADGRLPWPQEREAVATAVIRQAEQPLRDLAAAGALDEAGLQRQLALAEAALFAREQQRTSFWWHSAYKVATYRVAGFIDGVVVSLVMTGSIPQTAAMTLVYMVGTPIIAYANEVGWAAAGVGRPREALLDVEFPEIGNDRL